MTRRELIALLGSTAAAWPLRVLAQEPDRMRHIGVFINLAAETANTLGLTITPTLLAIADEVIE